MRNVVAGDGSQGTAVMEQANYKWKATTLEGFIQQLAVA